jgi:hypothetical protein
MLPLYTLFLLIPIKLAALFIIIRGTASGELKPNRVSLFLWSLPALVGFLISFSQGAYLSALPLLLAGAAPLFILFISFISKHKAWPTRKIDYVSGILSITAIILWLVVDQVWLATLFIIIADVCAGIPTFIKTWVKPATESVWVYILGTASCLIGLATLYIWTFATAGFSIYLLAFNILMIILILHKKFGKMIYRRV